MILIERNDILKRENFTRLLHRNNPDEILEYIKRHGKKPKSVCPLIFYDEQKDDKSSK